ncbi:MAG: 5-formyltetrahydrofolate cyclo-ligase [Candidatus Glassbacteria bacterium]|nr:5-formyltetrahydrofolate cyclo-ligase [Candidatus Glassbacteria bacterium]
MDQDRALRQKQALRQRIGTLRNKLDPDDQERMSSAIQRRLTTLPVWLDATFICTFVGSKTGEVNTRGIIRSALDSGKKVCVPVIDKSTLQLDLVELESDFRLVAGHFGILEPSEGTPRRPDEIGWDLALVPGLAFGCDGGRIGFGKGYYDRLLAVRRAPRVALAFEFQVLDSVPSLPHDIPLDMLVTERRLIRCT